MASNSPQIIGFDISKDLNNLDKLTKYLERYNIAIKAITDATITYNEKGKAQTATIETLDAAGRKVIVTMERLTDENGKLKRSLEVTSAKLKEAGVEWASYGDEIDHVYDLINRRAAERVQTSVNAQLQEIQSAIHNADELINLQNRITSNFENNRRREVIAAQESESQIIRRQNESLNLTEQLRQRDLQNAMRMFSAQTEAYGESISQQEKIAAGHTAQAFGKGLFGAIPVTANQDQRINFQTATASAASLVANGSISLARFQELATQIKAGTLTAFSESETGAVKAIQNIKTSYNQLGSAVQTNNQGILLSWQTMIRILEIQLIHNFFGSILTGLHQGYQDAIKLSIAIGEIKTISQDAQLSTDQWTNSVRELSDTYGKDLKDVAEGLYQTISNQTAKGADAVQFLNTALKFSITTVSSVADSVNLLTAAMNAYHLKVSDAENVSAGFFKTIELGRVRADEMANSLGHILPTAASLGISLQEVEAAIATLTISGLKFNEASTLISNVMLRLLKPTVEMKKVFNSWGVASGEAALAAFGFGGTLQKLEESAGGSSSELADLFKNIRAIRGAIGLTGSAFETYVTNLNKIKDATASYNKAFTLVEETPGKRLSDELQKVRNVFTVDFGTALVRQVVDITDSLGGLSNVLIEITHDGRALAEAYIIFRAGSWLLTGVPAVTRIFQFLEFGIRNNITSVEQLALGYKNLARGAGGLLASIGPQGFIVAGIIAATFAWDAHGREVQRQLDLEKTLGEVFTKQSAEIFEQRNKRLESSLTDMKKYSSFLFSYLIQSSTETGAAINGILEQQREGLKHNQEILQANTEAFLKGQTEAQSKLMEQQHKLDSEVQKTAERLAESKDRIDKASLNKLLDENYNDPAKQVQILSDKFKSLQKNMQDAFSAKNPELAIKYYNEATEIITKIGAIQERVNKVNTADQDKLNRGRERELELQLQAQLNDLRSGKRPAKGGHLVKEIKEVQDQLRELRNSNDIHDLEGGMDKTAESAKKAAEAVAAIQINFGKDAIGQLEKFWSDSLTNFGTTAAAEAKKLGDKAAAEEIRIALLRKTLGEITHFDALNKNGSLKYNTAAEAQVELDRLISQAESSGLQKGTDEWKQVWEQRGKIVSEIQTEIYSEIARKQQETFVQQKEQLDRLIGIAKDNLADVQKKVLDLYAKRNTSFGVLDDKTLDTLKGRAVALKTYPEYQTILDSLNIATNKNLDWEQRIRATLTFQQEVIKANSGFVNDTLFGRNLTAGGKPVQEVLQDVVFLSRELSKAQGEETQGKSVFKKLQDDLFSLTNDLAGLPPVTNSSINSVKTTFQELEIQIRKAREEAERLKTAIAEESAFNANNKASGGLISHFASGGGMGTDSVHAMLTPGEFVVNKSAAASFYPLLSALNSTRPQHFASGGDVSVGDINISGIPISGNTTVDAKAMGRAIRSEIRRGSLRL